MDAFEPIRQAAFRLHAKIVATGVNPERPIELIEATLRDLQLEFFLLKPGDPALKGARAIYDEQSGTICCEDAGELSERVLLIAHELGHAVSHTSSSACAAEYIDPAHSTETAPVGLQRVEDYGMRERRELQANVFAREFLFPRPQARQMYIDEALSASAIADRMSLPKNLIQQQLLDALLLPSREPEVEEPARPFRPDASQDRAAVHRGSAYQLQAGPGTGKTRTLIKRTLSLIAEGVDPSAILVLTFSNRAAGELAERLATAVPDSASRIWIGTFHAFGLDLIRRYHDKFGLPSNPALFDRSDAIEVLEDILPTLPLVHYRNLWDPAMVLRDVLVAISRAKDEMTDPTRYRKLAEAMLKRAGDDESREAAEKCIEVAQIYAIYEKAILSRGGVDFGDLVMRPALLLESDAALRTEVQLRHRHALVDEYQDVNHASTRLLRAVAGDGRRLWVVGDSRQSIYRFRGASSANMSTFMYEYVGATADKLSVNYRSTKQIIDVFSAFAPLMGASSGMLPLTLEADCGQGPGLPEIRGYDTLEQEAEGIAASIRELEAFGVRLRDQAVLCRTNRRLNEIAAALEARGIPVLHLGSLFERDEVRDLLALLSLAVDSYGSGLVRVGAMSQYGLSFQDFYVATRHLRKTNGPSLSGLADLPCLPGLSVEGAAGLERLAGDLLGFSTEWSAWEFLSTYLLDRSEIIREMARRETIADRMRAVALWQFLNFVRERSPISSGLPIQRILERVRHLVLFAEERDLRQVPQAALHMDAVRLMTVHGSKGLEFEAVHIPGLTAASFPCSYRGQRCPPPVGMIAGAEGLTVSEEAKREHEHEEECLFFVAMSRARIHLRLYLSRFQPSGKNRSPSCFLECIPRRLFREDPQPPILQLSPDALIQPSITITRPVDWQVTGSRLIAYDKCPRRFLYTHLLELGGARKATAFSRTHDCIWKLIHWLADARLDREPSIDSAEETFETTWLEQGPTDHAFAADYRRLASQLIGALVRAGANRRFCKAEVLAIDFTSGRVLIEPDEMAELPDGTVVLRRINTGYKRSDEYDRLDYTLYHLAGQARFRNRYIVEALHLTDGDAIEPVTITKRKIDARKDKAEKMVAEIAGGSFPAETDAVICPRCPHFFICAALPKGPLSIE
jgi:superfamily I DNA/RNA helicase/Zn-dependent peptidase ImmA (M78 family)